MAASPVSASLPARIEPGSPAAPVARIVAAGLHVTAGVLLAATVAGLAVAWLVLSRGLVAADPGDVASLRSMAPGASVFGIVAIGHVVAGLGMVLGVRRAALLGAGLGALDATAGLVAVVVAMTGPGQRSDGIGIGITLAIAGVLLAASALAALASTRPSAPRP